MCVIFLVIGLSDTSVSFHGLLTVLTKIVKNLPILDTKNQSECMVLTVELGQYRTCFVYLFLSVVCQLTHIMDYKLHQTPTLDINVPAFKVRTVEDKIIN